MSGGNGHSEGGGGDKKWWADTILDLPATIVHTSLSQAASAMGQVATAVSRILSGLFMIWGGGGGSGAHAHQHH